MFYWKVSHQLNHIMPLILEIPLSPPSNAQNTEHSYSEKGRIGTKEGKKSSFSGFLGSLLFRKAYSFKNIFKVVNLGHIGFKKQNLHVHNC